MMYRRSAEARSRWLEQHVKRLNFMFVAKHGTQAFTRRWQPFRCGCCAGGVERGGPQRAGSARREPATPLHSSHGGSLDTDSIPRDPRASV